MLIHNVRELGLRMRDRRHELGLTQAALAKRVGVSRFWVMQMERGNSGAEIGLVSRALQALGLTLEVGIAEAAVPASELPWSPDLAAILDRARENRP